MNEKLAARLARRAQKQRELEQTLAIDALSTLSGVNAEIAQALVNAGLGSLDAVRDASDESLLAISGIGKVTLARIREQLGVL